MVWIKKICVLIFKLFYIKKIVKLINGHNGYKIIVKLIYGHNGYFKRFFKILTICTCTDITQIPTPCA